MEKTILVIEDNLEVRENTAEILEISGYKVLTADNGVEGLKVARENKPDLILCDIMMPILDGYGVLKAIENIPEMSNTPFVFMTAKGEKEDFRKGMDLGADDYLVKPFEGNNLLNIVSARLKKQQLIRDSLESSLHVLNAHVDGKGLNSLSEHRSVKTIRKRDILFMEGDTANFLYFVIEGKIKVFKSNEQGKEYIIDIYKSGDFLGYASLLENEHYKESAMAIEDSKVSLIPKDDFFQLLYSNNEVTLTFVRLVSRNLVDASEKLLKLAYDSARKRVAEALLFTYRKYQQDGNEKAEFCLLRENLSALSGISPESVSRNLSDFKDEGLIETSNGHIKILNLKKLEQVKN